MATRSRARTRGTTTERGYGAAHQAERRRWAPLVATGTVGCARCGALIKAGALWDLGHVDGDRTRYQGPEHRRCNRGSAARRKNKGFRRNTRRPRSVGVVMVDDDW